MTKATLSLAALLLASSSILMANEKAEDAKKSAKVETHWSYKDGTAHGPEHWGSLAAEFGTCATGRNQSPINIDTDSIDAELPPIKFKYNMLTPSKIVNTPHSVQVDMWSGGEISLDETVFKLKQFHFHTPSENTINGKNAPLEAHFVHQSESGELAVVGIMFEPGEADRTLATLLQSLPMEKGKSADLDAKALKHMEGEFKVKEYFRFNGSLTTPPCTEGVRWIVMKRPMTVSKEQLEQFQQALKHPNSRPVQPLNARIVTY